MHDGVGVSNAKTARGVPPRHWVDEAWLALRSEDVLEPQRVIVDPHHHLWDRPQNTYLLPQLFADLESGHQVRGTVFVE